MCLTRKDKQYEIAKENITVYKVFYIRGNVLMSVFLFHEYELGLNIDKEKEEWYQHGSLVSLHGGALHSFKTLEDVVNSGISYDVVLECYIPKGSKYWEGIFNACSMSIASPELYVSNVCVKWNSFMDERFLNKLGFIPKPIK